MNFDTMQSPSVDVVVLNWRDAPRTIACIDSLKGHPQIARVIVVDNESDPLHELQLPLPGIEIDVLRLEDNLGFAGGVNTALDYLKSTNSSNDVLFLNNDAVLLPESLSFMCDALESNNGKGIIFPILLNVDSSIQSIGYRISRLSGFPRPNLVPRRVDFVPWAAVLIDNHSLGKIGPLDERFFMYWEDVDFAIRAKLAGVDFVLAPNAFVIHELSASSQKIGARLLLYSLWAAHELGRKYGGLWNLRMWLFFVLTLTKNLMLFRGKASRAILAGWNHDRGTPAWKFNY